MKKIICLASILITGFLPAQDPQNFVYKPLWPDPSAGLRHAIAFSGEYNAGSDAITNSFLDHLYRGGFIDSMEKNEQESYLLPSNRFGMYSGLSAAYTWRNKVDTVKWEFTVAYRDRQSLFGVFTDDAFHLAFEGNRDFLGETADLGGSKMTLIHWQQLQFEAKYFSADHRSEMVFGISALNGQQFMEADLREAKLFTYSNGTQLDADVNAAWYTSDTLTHGFGSRNGAGNCFNFRFSTLLGDSSSHFHSQIMFSVQDLGYIKWNMHSQLYRVDTAMSFNGVDASSVIMDPSNVSGMPSADSLVGTAKNGQIISFLPIGIRARYTVIIPSPFWFGADARIWSYTGASAQYSLFAGWHTPGFKFNATAGVAYGGFARLQFPIQVSYTPCKNFGVMLGSTNVAGYIAPAKTRGQGAYMNMTFAF